MTRHADAADAFAYGASVFEGVSRTVSQKQQRQAEFLGVEMSHIRPLVFKPSDPLDVMYDGASLRDLLFRNDCNSRIDHVVRLSAGPNKGKRVVQILSMTPLQRAMVSAHWSAELRCKVAESEHRERHQVTIDLASVVPEPWA